MKPQIITLFDEARLVSVTSKQDWQTPSNSLWTRTKPSCLRQCLWKQILSQKRIRHFKILQSIYCAYDVRIISSYSCIPVFPQACIDVFQQAKFLMFLYFHQHEINLWSLMLLYFLLLHSSYFVIWITKMH